ncbi:hypothetical protein ILUMI_14693 [Ignelater luminosus]|uniref:Uncharacterized protein n=1 Tax=Ignelater luminosus TaxID=2038154 RepID=A0A8K0G4L0_IGNLU|nr:hypothetical protein ILUMI_14693 [Ignelater luminosus]
MESKVLNPILSPLIFDGNYQRFKQRFKMYLAVNNLVKDTDEKKIALSSEATKRQAKDLQGKKVDVIRSEQKYMRGTRGYGKNINRKREKLKISMTA